MIGIIEPAQEHLFVYGERPNGTRHLLDLQPKREAVVRGWLRRGLAGIEQVSGAPDDLHNAVRTAFPKAQHGPLSQRVVAALGMAMQQPTIDTSQPHGLLPHLTDASLHVVIDGGTLVHLRRLMRDERDAVSVRRIA